MTLLLLSLNHLLSICFLVFVCNLYFIILEGIYQVNNVSGKEILMGNLMVLGVENVEQAVTVTKDMFSGLTAAITSNAEVLIPVGVGIMAIMVGISLIPRILYKFI